ncbi:2-C-methyl-D-erythritol 4-phosphate cytidylyltransferase [Chitiniphilus shinanonensis]|uniref:2-C-methyl-D-erythritol 4-phosphate cytidylyltransferase n=1 Tax=Chitiniphilus shinanonensis TaxID=553088 RepID=A0ABQ6BXD0_9NEIS|nr:2-C-methyl-D-erythritol 4-phosphate cytidylyltransferase [Chitiniphilus shinanonensis]GLS05971.1 2-C-methyl-D-erythritol 4-phosphate cytidylyltransferase [Chitiniphilus shinanonensis]
MTAIALVPAAGSGSRMGSAQPKQYLPLAGQPLIWHTLSALHAVPELERVVVVISPDDQVWDSHDWSAFDRLQVLRVGGDTRAQSVLNGLEALRAEYPAASAPAPAPARKLERVSISISLDVFPREATPQPELSQDGPWVLVHDAARPCIDPALVSGMIARLQHDPVGGILAVPVADTLKLARPGERIAHTQPRTGLWQAQTPQMFRLHALADALAGGTGADITDEASALERLGHSPVLVMGSPWNLKVTYPQDLRLATLVLAAHAEQQD